MALAVAVVGDGEPAGFGGAFLFSFEGFAFVGFGDLGGDGLQDPFGEDLELTGVVVGSEPDQLGLGLGLHHGQLVDRGDDHGGLVLGDRPCCEGGAGGAGAGRGHRPA